MSLELIKTTDFGANVERPWEAILDDGTQQAASMSCGCGCACDCPENQATCWGLEDGPAGRGVK